MDKSEHKIWILRKEAEGPDEKEMTLGTALKEITGCESIPFGEGSVAIQLGTEGYIETRNYIYELVQS